MIEINLLPGARKAKRTGGPAFAVSDVFANLTSQIKDGFLIFGVVGLVVGLLATGFLYFRVSGREAAINERIQTARSDSVRYHAVLRQRALALAQRDSVVRQLSIIRSIDGERFTWPHLLDQLSETLPPFTWLVDVRQTSPVMSIVTRDSASGAAAQRIEELADAAVAAANQLSIRIIGQTVDIQALTRYMRDLESSPFVQGVTLVGTQNKVVENVDVTEFTLDMQFQQPDPSVIRTVPLTISVR